MYDYIKFKLQNELQLASDEVEYLYFNGYDLDFSYEKITPLVMQYHLAIGNIDGEYMYTINFIRNMITGDFNFPPQVALKEKVE